MFPGFFSDPAEPLYGVYHRPDPAVARPVGVVLCQPGFHESAHCHRALRALGEQLAAAGVHALRFDYRGTGDSAGESSLEGWITDVGRARDELRASRGLEAVGLLGLRLGGSLAARAAAQGPPLPFLVLWEPVVDGQRHLDELRRLQAAWVAFEAEQRPGARQRATDGEILGHPLPPDLATALGSLDLLQGPPPRAARVLVVDETGGAPLAALEQRLGGAGLTVDRRSLDGGRIWGRELAGQQALVPRTVLEELVDWILQETGP